MPEQKTEEKKQDVQKEGGQEEVRKLVFMTDGNRFSVSPETTVSPLEAEMICRKYLGI